MSVLVHAVLNTDFLSSWARPAGESSSTSSSGESEFLIICSALVVSSG